MAVAGFFLGTLAGTVLGEFAPRHEKKVPWSSGRHLGGLIATCFQLGNMPRSVSFVLRGTDERLTVVAQRNEHLVVATAWRTSTEVPRSSFTSLVGLWLGLVDGEYASHFKTVTDADKAFHHGDNFDFHAVAGSAGQAGGLAYDVVEAAIGGHLPPKFVEIWMETMKTIEAQLRAVRLVCDQHGVEASIGVLEASPESLKAAVDTATPLSCFYDGLRAIEALPPAVASLMLNELVQEAYSPTPGSSGKSTAPGAALTLLDASEEPAAAVGRCRRGPRVVMGVTTRHFLEPVATAHWSVPADASYWLPFKEVSGLVEVAVAAIVNEDTDVK